MKPYSYENKFRPNYESYATLTWFIATLYSTYTFIVETHYIYLGMAVFSLFMCLSWGPKALAMARTRKRLGGEKVTLINSQQLKKKMAKYKGNIWLGLGYSWQPRHTQQAYEISKEDDTLMPEIDLETFGVPWIHGLEKHNKEPLLLPEIHSSLHTLILGTTGSGKTRCFDLAITQAILRGECVIIIDPKGDKELKENAKRACELAGSPEKFVYFHPGFPDESARIDPLFNFNRPSEVATRIANLVQTESGSDPFKAFGQMSLNNVIQGLYISNERPTIVKLRHYFEAGPDTLVVRAIESYADVKLNYPWEDSARSFTANAKNKYYKAIAMIKFYRDVIAPDHSSPDLEGLISMFEHDREHFGKMVATLLPVLNMLTSGDLGPLLSPDGSDDNDTRPITNTRRMIEAGEVVYIGLDSLSDLMVGSAIGSILLADLASVAGDRYNYGENLKPVNIFVDEAAEVLNDQLIQLLNKGRGALLRMTLATQTIADIETKLGSESKARMVLGNINNMIVLRTPDPQSQLYITDKIPKTKVTTIMRTQGTNSGSDPVLHGANVGERFMDEEADRIEPALLGKLPNLEFFSMTSGGKLSKGKLPVLVNKKAA